MSETEAKDAVETARANRRASRAAARQDSAGKGKESEVIPITEAASVGMPENLVVTEAGEGETPFRLMLRAPVIEKSKALYARMLSAFPDMVIAAATSDRRGKGIDIDAVSVLLHDQYNKSAEAEGKPEKKITKEEARAEVEDGLEDLFFEFAAYDPANPDPTNRLELISDCLWELAGGYNEGLTRDALPGLLQKHLKPVQIADLMRSMNRSLSGAEVAYEGDIQSRF